MTNPLMSNAIARKYFLHDLDINHDTGDRCCFFSDGMKENGWGFWVAPNGGVDIDEVSSNGKLPAKHIVDACVRAAIKHLRS